MEAKSSIKLNSILNIILSASAVLLSLVTYPYLTRVLKPTGVGTISFVRSVVSYFTLFAELGMPLYGMRACAKVKDNEALLADTVSELLSINISAHVVVASVLALTVAIIPQFRTSWILFLVLGIAMLIDCVNPVWLFRGIERYVFVTAMSIGGKIFTALGIFLLVKSESDTFVYACILAGCAAICSIADFLYMKAKVISKLPKLKRPQISKHLKPVMIFFLMSCATTLYINMDVVMLRLIKGQAEVGYYDVGLKVKTILNSISASLWTVALPRATGHWDSGDKKSAEDFIKKLLHVLYTIEFPLALFFIAFSDSAVMFLGGADYTEARIPMIFVLLSVFAIAIGNVISGEVLVSNGKEKIVLYSEITGVVVNLLLNYILIMKYSVLGAAIATLVTETLVTLIQLTYSKVSLKLALWNSKNILLPLSATILGILASIWVESLNILAFFKLAIGGCIFAIVYAIIMLLFKDEIVTDIFNTVISVIKKVFLRKNPN